MKIIYYTNWVILSLYAIYFIYNLLTINRGGLDAAGKGMSQAYSYIGLLAVAVLVLLNLINFDWVRVVILVVSLAPIYLSLRQKFRFKSGDKLFRQGKHNIRCFKDQHLKNLIYAVDTYNVEEVKQLLSEDSSNINDLGDCNTTILNTAVYNASVILSPEKDKIVEALLQSGADPNVIASTGTPHPPLARVAVRSSFKVFERLLKAGADPNARGEQDIPILCQLVKERNPSPEIDRKVELLLTKYNADPNISFGFEEWHKNDTALILATKNDMWKVCIMLIEAGADVNHKPHHEHSLDFWKCLLRSWHSYYEKGDTPKAFHQLIALPIVKERFKK